MHIPNSRLYPFRKDFLNTLNIYQLLCSRARPVNRAAARNAPLRFGSGDMKEGAAGRSAGGAVGRRGVGGTNIATAHGGGGLLQLKHFFVDQLADVSFPERLLVYVRM
jgi:hypothetical protein